MEGMIDDSLGSYCFDIMNKLNAQREKGIFCDISLKIDGKTFWAHRNVLAAGSAYFHKLFSSEMKEKDAETIELDELRSSVAEELLTYLYTGKVEVGESNAEDLITSANYLLLTRLKQVACALLQEQTTVSNCIYMYSFAERYHCSKLKDYALELMNRNFVAVSRSKDFLNLSVEQLKELLSSDEIIVEGEEEVFEAVVQWVNHEPVEREKYFPELFGLVRLTLVSIHYLHTHLINNELVKHNQSSLDLVLDAFKWLSLSSGEFLPLQEPRICLRSHVDSIVTCGGRSPSGMVRDDTLCYVPSEDHWYELAPMNSKRCRHGLVMCQGFMYALGGEGEGGTYCSSERFDPRTNSWCGIADMPKRVKLSGVAVLKGKIYVVGGMESGCQRCDVVQCYDPFTNTWSLTASLSGCRSSVCVVTDGHYLFAIGGLQMSQFLKTAEKYDPVPKRWMKIAPMHERRGCACGVTCHERIFVMGGTVDLSSSEALSCCETYNTRTDEWHRMASMQIPRFHAGAVMVRGVVFVFGGIGYKNAKQENLRLVECYDIKKDEWKTRQLMPYEETYFRCCAVSMFKEFLHSLPAKI